jgi:choline monooxygenase
MGERTFEVDADIRRAETPPGWVYTDPEFYVRVRERVLARTWRLVGDTHEVSTPGSVKPVDYLPGALDEPLLIARGMDDELRCLSNVCTHRGMRVVEHADHAKRLTCRYHGRCFELDGRLRSMPEFEAAEGFPRPGGADDLRRVPMGWWRQFLFASLDPVHPLEDLIREMDARVGFLPIEEGRLDQTRMREYVVRANWALYIDNYLEGFHIPFVHPSLAGALDYGQYETETHALSNLQLGIASGGDDTFDLPAGHPDDGREVAAWYFWLFPTTMFNVYPWGISVNDVRPVAVDRTKVTFLPYVWDADRLDRGAGSDLDRVEREDESVVEAVHASIGSRHYTTGRYSPAREGCVHHFHRLLAAHA